MTYQWDFSFLITNWAVVAAGLINTLKLAVTSILGGLALGLIAGSAKSSRSVLLRMVGTVWIEAFRNVPAMVLVFWCFFAVPILTGIQNDRFTVSAIALTLYASAYFGEIYRSGIESVERGQWEAAKALGFGYLDQMRYFILPQAVTRMIPAFTNEAIEVVKLTAIASTIAYAELMYAAKQLSDTEYRPVEAYTAISVLFIAVLYVLSMVSRRVEATMNART
ncbi:amino acid ABC transporter permease [Phreatobacter stygius]|uniref:Amino acid ABC transporter permease n=1 Tax=Phreatobacter stygius TaxID=1940610 RepID=A0A4D7B511_9HYPH|nr:amino acid ABC transporter permease [Phreatobacter stygius]QCI65170.1 amino acid ABC transporter permease [Phreatobacter stygius]